MRAEEEVGPSPTPRSTGGNHRPPLGAHRLMGQGRGAALLRPNGEVDWWCPDRFDATPLLWSLLDPDGGISRWVDAQLVTWAADPAGPTAHSVLRCGDQRIESWDGLLAVADTTVLVRLARTLGPRLVVAHELRCGGFDEPWRTWRLTDENDVAVSDGLALVGVGEFDHEVGADGRTVTTTVRLTDDQWSGVVVISGSGLGKADVAANCERWMLDADADERSFLRDIRLPHHHPSRGVDAMRVLRALTDAASGAPVASPTTSLPEAPGGTRQFDYRFTWLRDSAQASATAALLGRCRASSDYLDFVDELLIRSGDELTPLTTSRGDPVPDEQEVAGVAGWGGSLPIRTGNAASGQCQLDAVATVIEAISVHVQSGGRMTRRRWQSVEHLARLLADGPFVADAATLLACTNGFFRRRSRSSRSLALATVAALEEGSFMRRYLPGADDMTGVADFKGVEGAFVPSSWLAVSALVAAGETDAAQRRADDMCVHLPPLQPEEWCVENDEGLGNTPLLWSHTESARALYNLHTARIRRRYSPIGLFLWRVGRYIRLRASFDRSGR